MEKQHTEQSSLNAEKALYKKFFIVMVLAGGMIGGWVFIPAFLWLGLIYFGKFLNILNNGLIDFLNFSMLNALLGLPAAWLTACSVRKRGLRRNWQGCLKTAAWGAWWSVCTIGAVLNILFVYFFVLTVEKPVMDWEEVGMAFSYTTLMPALCGLVSAALLSLLLPKPETDS